MFNLIRKKEAIEILGLDEAFWEKYLQGRIPRYGLKFNLDDIKCVIEQILQDKREAYGIGVNNNRTEGKQCLMKDQKLGTAMNAKSTMSIKDIVV